MKVLGIETSCDETSASVVECQNNNIRILSNVVSSQVKLHAKWGGVVPNLAAREHLKNIIPVLKLALKEANTAPADLDLIAVTNGPGLIPALLIGTSSAKTLSYFWKKPLIGIHHIKGHIAANFISDKISRSSNNQIPNPKQIQNTKYKIRDTGIKFPALALIVSGGHTQLIYMKKNMSYEIIGQTLDDAVGEAFDKVARILNIGYPGGPAIALVADQYGLNAEKRGKIKSPRASVLSLRRSAIILPRPMINKNNFDFSFSGLKTAVLYKVKSLKTINYKLKTELCHEFQQAIIDVLISKTVKAAKKYNPKTIMLAGGVAANLELRKQLGKAIKNNLSTTTYNLLPNEYTSDNAAMIATAACFRWKKMTKAQKKKALQNWKTLTTDANLKLNEN